MYIERERDLIAKHALKKSRETLKKIINRKYARTSRKIPPGSDRVRWAPMGPMGPKENMYKYLKRKCKKK